MKTSTKSISCSACGTRLSATASGPNRKVQKMAWEAVQDKAQKEGWGISFKFDVADVWTFYGVYPRYFCPEHIPPRIIKEPTNDSI